jgi:hypothetical protein
VTAKVTKLVGLSTILLLSPFNLVIFAGTQNGEYKILNSFGLNTGGFFFRILSRNIWFLIEGISNYYFFHTNTTNTGFAIDKKYIKSVHVVCKTLPH